MKTALLRQVTTDRSGGAPVPRVSKKLKDEPIESLELQTVYKNCLSRNNVHTIGRLLELSVTNLRRRRGIGEMTVIAIQVALHGYREDLCIGMQST
ncbi:MAG: Bacterial polymerase, alpha chain terminal domain [Candidatus Taylorbacteria bacterium]|nr:Bacterial polymerase, alpha chain terminal domain [Candidatus Taylorbacteria bacterium]